MNAKISNTYGSALRTDSVASVALLAAAILIVLSGVFAGLTEDSSLPSIQTSVQAPQVTSSA